MKHFFKSASLAPILLAFLLRLIFILGNPNIYYTQQKSLASEREYFTKGIPPSDSQEYELLAKNLIQNKSFTWNREPVAFRTPLYPIFLLLFGLNYSIILLAQVLLSVGSAYLLYLIARLIDGRERLLILVPCALFAVDGVSIFFTGIIMAETLFISLVLLGTYLILQKRVFLSGFTFGLSALTKPVAIYLSLPVILYLIITKFQLKKNLPLFILGFFLFPGIWILRNNRVFGTLGFSTVGSYNLLYFNFLRWEASNRKIDIDSATKEITKELEPKFARATNPFQCASIAREYAIKKIVTNPISYIYYHLRSLPVSLYRTKFDDIIIRSWFKEKESTSILKKYLSSRVPIYRKFIVLFFAGFELILISVSLILALISVIFMRNLNLSKEKRLMLTLLFLFFLYLFFVSGTVPDSRFRLHYIPFIYLLTNQGIFLLKDRFKL